MANQEQLELLRQGSDVWNEWRTLHSKVNIDLSDADISRDTLSRPGIIRVGLSSSGPNLSEAYLNGANLSRATLINADLSRAYLREANLSGADLSRANLSEATLSGADLYEANLRGAFLIDATLSGAALRGAILSGATLSGANLRGATFSGANLHGADLRGTDLDGATFTGANLYEANLSGADLSGAGLSGAGLSGADLDGATLHGASLDGANLFKANLSDADLSGADLSRATLVETNLTRATLTQCSVYGISVWNAQLDGAKQENLVITDVGEPAITVDNLEVAQFIYLLLNNTKIRDVIDTIAKKAVLILGRFTPERKAVLDALRETLRTNDYLPILFDFEKPSSRNITETVSTLAHLSRFVIADLTDPASIPQELYAIVPTLAVPIQPLVEVSQKEYSMFDDLKRTYHWVLPTYRYTDLLALVTSLPTHIIAPAEQKADELSKR